MTIRPASDRSLFVEFGSEISLDIHHHVFHLTRALKGVRGILNLHPAYASLLVEFDPRMRSFEEMESLILKGIDSERLAHSHEPPRTIDIPVRYGGEFGPDLADVAKHTGLAPESVVEMHAAGEYLVYFVGFMPGFAYLGGLAPELATPRLSAPRKQVPAGSVAIGGNQTGVYPMQSPGGWRIIGHTRAKLFDPDAADPTLLKMGDHVRFVPEQYA